jgi:hypothetical protein
MLESISIFSEADNVEEWEALSRIETHLLIFIQELVNHKSFTQFSLVNDRSYDANFSLRFQPRTTTKQSLIPKGGWALDENNESLRILAVLSLITEVLSFMLRSDSV